MNTSLSSQFFIDNTSPVNNANHQIFVNMEDLMVFCNSTASIYELSRPPTSNGQIQPATPPLDEEDSQGPKDVDLDAEGYIHHFRDSSHQKIVSPQDIGSSTSVICAPSDDLTNNSGLKRNAGVNGSSSEADAGCYAVPSEGTSEDAWKNSAVPCVFLDKSFKGPHLNQRLSNNADNTADYAAIRSMVQAAPDPTIWGNKMMTKVSTRPMSADTEEHKASEDSDTSTISSLRHDSLDLQEANHASKADTDDNLGEHCFNSPSDSGGHEYKPTPKAKWPNGEPNIQQPSRVSHSLEPEQDSLLSVSSVFLFRVFESKLT